MRMVAKALQPFLSTLLPRDLKVLLCYRYGYPKTPVLEDARIFFEWVIPAAADNRSFQMIKEGPRIVITGKAPRVAKKKLTAEMPS